MGASPVEHILREMQGLYGNLFEKQWSGQSLMEMVPFWERKLQGFSREELRRGFRALETLRFPPTLPEFMALCRPPVDALKAYHEAVKGISDRRVGRHGEWSHPAIFWTAASMAHDLLNMSYGQVRARFEERLEKELAKGSWAPVPEPPETLPPPAVDRGKSRAVAQEGMRRVRDILGGMALPERTG